MGKNIFHGATVLLTGASSGIGEAFAYRLAQHGANLILTARTETRLKEIADAIIARHEVDVQVIPADLSLPESPRRLMETIKDKSLSVDILINNAGFGKWAGFLCERLETYESMLALNIDALTRLTYLCLPEMLARGSGGVINVASTAAFQPVPYQAVYAASKAYVLNFTEALAGEYGQKGLRCMALCPGNTATNFMEVANANTEGMPFSSPEAVAESALRAFIKGKVSHIHGTSNYVTAILPRVLSRLAVVKIVARMFEQRVEPCEMPPHVQGAEQQ